MPELPETMRPKGVGTYTYVRVTGANVGKVIGPAKSHVYGAAPDDENDANEPTATS